MKAVIGIIGTALALSACSGNDVVEKCVEAQMDAFDKANPSSKEDQRARALAGKYKECTALARG
jgi:hypothetical protein